MQNLIKQLSKFSSFLTMSSKTNHLFENQDEKGYSLIQRINYKTFKDYYAKGFLLINISKSKFETMVYHYIQDGEVPNAKTMEKFLTLPQLKMKKNIVAKFYNDNKIISPERITLVHSDGQVRNGVGFKCETVSAQSIIGLPMNSEFTKIFVSEILMNQQEVVISKLREKFGSNKEHIFVKSKFSFGDNDEYEFKTMLSKNLQHCRYYNLISMNHSCYRDFIFGKLFNWNTLYNIDNVNSIVATTFRILGLNELTEAVNARKFIPKPRKEDFNSEEEYNLELKFYNDVKVEIIASIFVLVSQDTKLHSTKVLNRAKTHLIDAIMRYFSSIEDARGEDKEYAEEIVKTILNGNLNVEMLFQIEGVYREASCQFKNTVNLHDGIYCNEESFEEVHNFIKAVYEESGVKYEIEKKDIIIPAVDESLFEKEIFDLKHYKDKLAKNNSYNKYYMNILLEHELDIESAMQFLREGDIMTASNNNAKRFLKFQKEGEEKTQAQFEKALKFVESL